MRSRPGPAMLLTFSIVAFAAGQAHAQGLVEAAKPSTDLTSIRLQIPLSQVSFTRLDRLDNDPILNLIAVIAGHQRGRLLAELAAGLSYIRAPPASSVLDLAVRAGLAPWQHDTRRWDQYRSPLGWLVQADVLAGYRYLRFPNTSRGGNRLTTLAAIDAAYFGGGDSLGLSVRFAVGLTWSPWDEPQVPDLDYRVLKDVSLALGVVF